MFMLILDGGCDLSSETPTPIDVGRRRRLAPEAVVSLDWHDDMSELILDINEKFDAVTDDRARRDYPQAAARTRQEMTFRGTECSGVPFVTASQR